MRYLEAMVRCQRAAMDAVGEVLSDLSGGGYSVDDPLDLIQAKARGGWDYSELAQGDPAWVTLRAYFASAAGPEELLDNLRTELDRLRHLDLGVIEEPAARWVDEEDWAENWKQYFKPLRVGRRIVIVPSWEQYAASPDDLLLPLDPGMAFGTGQHATTALCLAWLEELVTPGLRMIDAGTGSGILSIAAAKLGAQEIFAFDVDVVAVDVARRNVADCGVADRITVERCLMDEAPVAAFVQQGAPGLVVANIVSGVIVAICPDVAAVLQPGARFLASGIVLGDKQRVLDAMQAAGLAPQEVREENGWVAILAVRV